MNVTCLLTSRIEFVGAGTHRERAIRSDVAPPAGEQIAESIRAFDAMGISVDQLRGKAPEEQFELITSALADVADASTRAAPAPDVFGRAGTSLLPSLAAGSAELPDSPPALGALGICGLRGAAGAARREALGRSERGGYRD